MIIIKPGRVIKAGPCSISRDTGNPQYPLYSLNSFLRALQTYTLPMFDSTECINRP